MEQLIKNFDFGALEQNGDASKSGKLGNFKKGQQVKVDLNNFKLDVIQEQTHDELDDESRTFEPSESQFQSRKTNLLVVQSE